MNKKLTGLVGLLFSISIFATAANAQVAGALTQNVETGHYYQVFGANIIAWDTASGFVDNEANVPCLDPLGSPIACSDPDAVAPHLATITSARENEFVNDLRASPVISRPELWLGGLQECIGDEEVVVCPPVGEGWQWVNNEGAIPTSQSQPTNPSDPSWNPSYSNWLDGEPNDANNGESYLAIGLGNSAGWNDEGYLPNIGGFIVEWDVPLPAAGCVGGDGCTTIIGQTLIFPEGSNPDDATISFNSFEFRDPRVDTNGVCNVRRVLKLFGDTGIGSPNVTPGEPGYRPPMTIPPYLCGSPSFVVVAVDAEDLVFETGTVDVRNQTDLVLPGNFYPEFGGPITGSVCLDPIVQDYPDYGDPQYQDIGTWQDTKTPTQMLEVDGIVGGMGEFEGATGEFTNECGSSRLRVKGASYFGIGLRIDFGPDFEWANNPAGNFGQFVALTRYKLTLLQKSVDDAKLNDGFQKNADYNKMKNMVRNAITALDAGLYSNALDLVQNFVKFNGRADYNIVDGENYEGEHLMRGTNIEFTLRVKVVPYAPVP